MNVRDLFEIRQDPVHPGWMQVMHDGVAIAAQFGGYERALETVLARTCRGCGFVAAAPFVRSPRSDLPLCLECSVGLGMIDAERRWTEEDVMALAKQLGNQV